MYYADGVLFANALFAYYTGHKEECIEVLRDLAIKSNVYAVKKNAIKDLMIIYARIEEESEFEKIWDMFYNTVTAKGAVLSKPLDIHEAKEMPLVCTEWYFITAPNKKVYYPFYTSPTGYAKI